MEYKDLEMALMSEAEVIDSRGENWSAERVADRLREIAVQIGKLGKQRVSGINASMGKRSGSKIDI